MLETGDDSIEAIANEVGYEDTSFFGRLFRRKVGLARGRIPAALRQPAQGGTRHVGRYSRGSKSSATPLMQ